jgi:hypothetical protein
MNLECGGQRSAELTLQKVQIARKYIDKTDGYNFSVRGCIQKFSDWVDNEIYAYKNKHSLRSRTKGYSGKTD